MGGFSQWEIDSAQATKDLATDVSAAAKPYVQDAADFWNDAKAAMTDPQGQKADAASFWADAKQQQADKLKQSVSYSATQNQDEYAKNLKLGQQMGVSPELAKDYHADLEQAAATSRMNYLNFSQQNPRTTAWASDPQNAAVAGVDEIHRVGAIEQSADFIRALTPKQEFESKYVKPLEKAIFSFPLARAGIEMLKGTEQFAANVGVRFGLRENALQQAAESLSPERFGSYQKPEDVLAQQLGPLVATYPIGVAGRVLTAAGMSAEAASVATGLATGAAFTAEQSGATYTAMKQRGATEEQAWSAANKVALVNAPFQALFGFTHILPQRAALRAYTEMIASGESEAAARTAASRAAILGGVLPSVGVGGLTGAAGQVGQNWITGRPTTEDVGKAALTGAMTQAGMHLGMGFFEQMANVIAHTDQSQLKVRSPQQFKQAMQAVFDGQESLRIPVEQFETYFQSQNMDPAAVAASLGVQNYAEAKTGATDVEVPTPDFLSKLDKEHQEALLPDIKDPATNMTFNQTVQGQKDLQEWAASGGPEKLREMTEAATKDVDAETAATPEYQQVKQELKKRFMDAGDTEPIAEANATLQANVHSYLARETGMKPTEVLALTNPVIRVGEAPEGKLSEMTLEQGAGDRGTQPRQETPAGATKPPWDIPEKDFHDTYAVHYDVRPGAEDRVEQIMREGLRRGYVGPSEVSEKDLPGTPSRGWADFHDVNMKGARGYLIPWSETKDLLSVKRGTKPVATFRLSRDRQPVFEAVREYNQKSDVLPALSEGAETTLYQALNTALRAPKTGVALEVATLQKTLRKEGLGHIVQEFKTSAKYDQWTPEEHAQELRRVAQQNGVDLGPVTDFRVNEQGKQVIRRGIDNLVRMKDAEDTDVTKVIASVALDPQGSYDYTAEQAQKWKGTDDQLAANYKQIADAIEETAKNVGEPLRVRKLEAAAPLALPESSEGAATLYQSATLRSGKETLRKYGLDPEGSYTTREVAAALEARQREKYGTIAPDDRSPQARDRIAKWMQTEVEFEMQNPADSGIGWYSEKFQRALDRMGDAYPELKTDKDARNLMTALIAITSDGQKVVPNFTQAMEIYGRFREGGETEGKFTTARGHQRQASIENNLATIQRLYDKFGPVELHKYLMQEKTISELKQIAKEHGLELKSDYQAHIKMPMAAVMFGPKLGAFYANLMGAHGYLTMDRWWSRTFNRYRGTLLQAPTEAGLARFRELLGKPEMSNDETIAATVTPRNSYAEKGYKNGTEIEKAANTIYKAAFENLEDAPFNAKDRTFMLDAVNKAQQNLEKKGVKLSVADIQAILWYYEKRLYGELGTRQTADVSYEDAAQRVVSGIAGQRGELPVPGERGEPPEDGGAAGGGVPGATPVGETLYQAGEQQPRGWITVHPDGSVEIGKTPRGDLSTYSHEFAHAYMKVLENLTKREGASDVIKGDYQKILDFLGAKAGEPLTVDQHEMWARANEQFLREGKAPNKSMRGVFQRFAVWLSSIYKKATDLGVELTPEIREVLGRFYAGDEAVDKAEQESGPQQFNSPEEAGWTPEQFAKYAESRGMEADQARAEIMAKLNAAALRDRTDAWQEEEQAVRTAKTDEIDARPEYQAIRALRKGEIGDGEEAQPLTLNKDELVKQFGEERVKALQEQHRGLYRVEGGTDAQTAAEMLGYSSGEELMQALESAPRRRQAIERETRQYMTAKHGDIRYDGSLEDKARVALENDKRADRLHKELTALQGKLSALKEKVAGQKAAVRAVKIAPIQAYREAAHAMVEAKPVVDLQPTRYLDASRKYSREAFDAGLKGKVEEAAVAKHKELINHFLYREAVEAKAFIADFEAYTRRAQGKPFQQTLGKAGGDYRAQFNGLLVRYGLMQGQAQATGLAAFAQAQYDLMKEPAIDPALMDETRILNYKHASVSEVRIVNEALKNIRKLANQELGMIVNGRRVVFVNAIEAMAARARDVNKVTPQRVLERNRTAGEVAVNLVEQFDATLLPAERLIEMLDGGRTGPWHDFLWHLAADSQGAEEALNAEVTKAVAEAFERMPKEQRHSMFDKVSVPGIMEDVTRHDLISMAFNMGNEGNLDRLRQTLEDPRIGMDPAVIDHLKNGLLSREDWQFVQDVWKVLAKVGEKSFAFEERMNGIPPVAVKPQPFTVTLRGGETMELEGGYYTVHYDPRFSHAGATQEASTTAQGLTQPGYTRATTSKGHLKERSGYGGPLLFDFEQTLTQHLTKTIKDITHREFALSANKLLMHPTVRGAIQETMGPAYEKQMLPWLRTIINDRNGSATQGLGIVSKSMRVLRKNMVLASLGFKVGTNILQILHAPRMMLYTRPSAYMQALSDYVANPREFTEQIRSMSPNEMASRGSHTDRDYREMMQEATNQQGWRARFAAAGTVTFRYIDHMLSFPLWMSVYRDALREPTDLTELEQKYQAMQLADRAVRLGLGAHSPKDMAPIMRDNDFTKLITVLYGFHSGVYGQQRALVHELRYDGTKGIPKFTYGILMAAIVPSILSNLVRGKKPDKDESAGHWAAMTALMYSLETIPVLRDVVGALDRGGDVKFSPIGDVLGKGVKIAQEIKADKPHKDYESLGLNALDVGGTLAGIPGTAQVVKPLRYYHNVAKGKIAHPNLYDAFIGSGKTH